MSNLSSIINNLFVSLICVSTVHPRHSQSRTYVLTAAIAASLLPVRSQFTRATRKAALACLPRLPPLLCSLSGHSSPAPLAKPHLRAYCGYRRFFAPCAVTVHPRHSQSRTYVLTAAIAASLLVDRRSLHGHNCSKNHASMIFSHSYVHG